VQATSLTMQYKSMIEVGGGSGNTYCTAMNVHFLDASGRDQVGDLTQFYTTTESAFNIKGTTNTLALNGITVLNNGVSSNLLPLQMTSQGPYTFAATSYSTLVVPVGGMVVKAGTQLSLAAGASVTLYGMLVVEAGAKLIAAGTAGMPITFTGVNSASGILILGGSGTGADSKTFTDIASGSTAAIPSYTNTYGGAVQTQSIMTYCYLDTIGDNNADVNALTLVGLDATHTFNYLNVVNAQDDGIEVFDGSVNLSNIMITDAVRLVYFA
jgi:hypothetical protein